MDLSALESAVRALERSLDSVEFWLAASTFLVVIGLILEYWYDVSDLIRKIKRRPPFPWKKLPEMVGGILVTIGVTLELVFQFHASKIETDIRSKSHQIEALLDTAAGKAEEKAANAQRDAENAKAQSEAFQAEIADSNARAKSAEAQVASANAASREAVAKVAGADARIGEANRGAAEANLAAESEKLARIKIEQQLAPRTLSDSDRQAIANQLRSFTPAFSGRKVKVSSYVADVEGLVFGLEIMDMLSRAGIQTDPALSRSMPINFVTVGVKISGPISDGQFIKSLMTGIHAHLDTVPQGEWDPKYSEVSIEVGSKPIVGLPTVISPKPKVEGTPKNKVKYHLPYFPPN